jgi:hypothetical protein
MRRWAVLASALIMVSVSACSTRDDDQVALPSADTTTALSVAVDNGKGGNQTFTVRCDPPGGDHPRPKSACEFLDQAAEWGQDPFAPVSEGSVCAEVYGGPQTATVTGLWRGKHIDSQFSRTDACQSRRWDNAMSLLAVRGDGAGAAIRQGVAVS